LVAPAGPLREPDAIPRAAKQCRTLGYEPIVGAHADAQYGYLAGSDRERLEDLHASVIDPSIDGVWCLRGGYGTPRLLADLDYEAFARTPKVLIGFSDITALLQAVTQKAGIVTFHGPIAHRPLTDFTRDALAAVTTEARAAGPLPPAPASDGGSTRPACLTPGSAEGPLYGGNLSLLCSVVGTPYLPDLEGALLVLEEVGEELYAIDRDLAHLRLAGILDRLAGVVVGQFTDVKKDTPSDPIRIEDVLETYLGPLGIPVATGFPIGHVNNQWTLPLGVNTRLDAEAGTRTSLEPAVQSPD